MTTVDGPRWGLAVLCCAVSLSAAGASARQSKPQPKPQDPVEPARAALRTLQFDKAITLLNGAGNAGNADAQYLLALMYLGAVHWPMPRKTVQPLRPTCSWRWAPMRAPWTRPAPAR